jgi:hypothetical protein
VGATPWRFESSSPHQLLLFRINHLVSIALAAGLLLGQKIAALSCRIVAALADTLKREFERLGKQTGQFFGGGHGAFSIWCGRSSCNLESSFATRSHGHMACGLLSMRVLRPRDPARDCRHRLSAPHARKFASVWRSTGEPRNLSGRGYADPDHTGKPEFFSLPAPDDDEIARVAGRPPDSLRKRIEAELEKIASSEPGEARTKLELLAENIVSDALRGDSQIRKLLIERLYPMLNRHEIAGVEGEAINIRWEAEMKQASEELREIIGGR